MAYGNLPGGGFTGYIKAEKPLSIKKRSYVPIKEEWPPKYGLYGEGISDTGKPLSKDYELEKDGLAIFEPGKKPIISKPDTKKAKKLKSPKKKVTFDEENLEQYSDIITTPEDDSKTTTKKKDARKVKRKVKGERVSGEKYPEIDDSKLVKTKEKGKLKKVRKPQSSKDELKDVKISSKKIKDAKKGKRHRKKVTFDEENLEQYSDSITTDDQAREVGLKPSTKITIDDKYTEDESDISVKDKAQKIKGKRGKASAVQKKQKRERKKAQPQSSEDESMKNIKISTKKMKRMEKALNIPKSLKKQDSVITFLPKKEEKIPESQSDEEEELYVKFRRPKKIPTYTYLKRKRSLLRFCPCLDRLLHSKRINYRGLKAMLGFPIGALFGFAIYWIVLNRIGAERYYFWLLGICVGVGFAISTQVRCICLLSIPACCGRAGRAFVSTYVVAYVIEGPFTNILANAKEAMRSISCTASLNLNHSVERFQLMFKPVKEIVLDFVGAGDSVQKDTKQLEKTFEGVENEVRDENEVGEYVADVKELDEEVGAESRVDVIKKKFKKSRKSNFGEDSEKNYGMKSEFRCESVFTKGVRGCYDSFGKAYDRCHSYLPIIGYLLCWPMKLTFICDLASSLMGRRACDSDEVMNPGFGASVDTADSVQSEFDKDFAIQLQYKLIVPDESVNQLVPEDVSGAMKYSFERRKKNLDFFTQLVDRILAVLCLLVLNSSRKYCNQYLRIIQFDNKYVTSYFRHIDARRQKAGKIVLLPLKKGERIELFNPFTVRFSADEKIMLIVNGVKLVSEVLTVTILLLFDRVFYELLDVIKRHANVTYKQTGVHRIKMTIFGDGFVGNMVRGILKGFDKKHSADQVTTTEECLPLPTKLPREMITRLYFVFLLLLAFIILESYTLRLRRVICAFFYPKREKRRIIFLYNDRLKKRRSFLQHMRRTVRKQAREQAIAIDSGVFFTLRQFYPNYFSWVSKLGLGLAKCLICSETESKTCHLIACQDCPFSYCSECWQDTEGKCYACLPDDDTEPSEDSVSDE